MPVTAHASDTPSRTSSGLGLLAPLIAVLVIAVGCSAPPSPTEPDGPVADDAVGLQQVQFLGTHNSYKERPDLGLLAILMFGAALVPGLAGEGLDPAQIGYGHRPLTTQLDSGIRSFELDVWADPTGGRFAAPLAAQLLGQPYPTGVQAPGMKVLHIQEVDYRSTCPTLVSCLDEMRSWSDNHPGHLPITINLELKQDRLPWPFDVTPIQEFDSTQLDALDDEIRSVLDDRLITPDEVRGDASDLREAVTVADSGGGWPTLAASRGRFLLYMDNGGSLPLLYLRGHPSLDHRVLFTSDGFDRPDGAVLKVNEPGDGSRIADLVRRGFLVRTRADADVVNPGADKAVALASGAQMVHTDFPAGEPQLFTGYEVSFPTRAQARCNPVNTSADTCDAAAVVEPTD